MIRAVAVVLALLLLLAVLAIFPGHARSDEPVTATAVPAAMFEAIRSVGNPRLSGQATPAPALPQPRTLTTARRPATPPSASSVPTATPVRIPASTERAVAVTGTQAGFDKAPSRPALSKASSVGALTGIASWFASTAGVSAAGPALRLALGPNWRGSIVRVSGPVGSAMVVLGDWCSCYPGTATERLIDLDAASFRAACGPLALGLCAVDVGW